MCIPQIKNTRFVKLGADAHSFFFCRIPVVLESDLVISAGGGGEGGRGGAPPAPPPHKFAPALLSVSHTSNSRVLTSKPRCGRFHSGEFSPLPFSLIIRVSSRVLFLHRANCIYKGKSLGARVRASGISLCSLKNLFPNFHQT